MSEYRVDVKVRNNLFLRKLEQAGYKTVGEFCRINNLMSKASVIGDILAMKRSPLDRNGEFVPTVETVCEIIGCSPYELFTDVQLNTVLKTNKKSMMISEAEAQFYLENSEPKLLEDMVMDDQKIDIVEQSLKGLTPREAEVIKMRFGLGENSECMTLEECGKKFDVNRERIRQIEARALRKLRHPSLAKPLRQLIGN